MAHKYSSDQQSCSSDSSSEDGTQSTNNNNNSNNSNTIKDIPAFRSTPASAVSSSRKSKNHQRRNQITICVTNCRYEIIKKIVNKFGYREVTDTETWNLYWTDLSITVDRCKEMRRFQKINHFPGMLEICRKDLLARNLNRMLRLYPRDYNFFPRTWCLPADLGDAMAYSRVRRNKNFILKPDTGSQGRGIFITRSLKEVKPCNRGICQVYLNKPFLVDGFKFDLRIYTLLTSCDPLRIYVYNEGLVRFATCKYKEPNPTNITNVFMHLTNYAVNKYSRTYNLDTVEGSKRKLSWLNDYLLTLGHDVAKLWRQIDDILIKTVISAFPILKHSYAACFPNHDVIPACCELLGIDIILDKRLNPLLLEVNHSPSFHTDTTLDYEIKEAVLTDMFKMLNLEHCNKARIIREDKRRVRERLLNGFNATNSKDGGSVTTQNTTSIGDGSNSFELYHKFEADHCGGFRLVYPRSATKAQYAKFFDQGLNSLYSETAASRAREAAQNALRDEMQMKARLEDAKRVKKLEPMAGTAQKLAGKLPTGGLYNANFEPQIIVESEEKERLERLAQRDYLVRSQGILEIIYFAMKKNGHLRPHDERKFAIFDKLRSARQKLFGTDDGVGISDLVETIKNKCEIVDDSSNPKLSTDPNHNSNDNTNSNANNNNNNNDNSTVYVSK